MCVCVCVCVWCLHGNYLGPIVNLKVFALGNHCGYVTLWVVPLCLYAFMCQGVVTCAVGFHGYELATHVL